jgi:hypothetical protein
MLDNYFQIDHADNTLFIRKTGKETLIVRIYVNDIVFGATHDSLSHEFGIEGKSHARSPISTSIKISSDLILIPHFIEA